MPLRLLIVLLVLLACGCGGRVLTQWPRQEIFAAYVRQQEVKLGMTQAEVEGIMGPPQVRQEGDYRQGRFVMYFYRTHNMDYEGSGTVRGGYTPFIFQNDRLVGKGQRDYRHTIDRAASEEPPPSPAAPTLFQQRTW